jgi:hypothetical protein
MCETGMTGIIHQAEELPLLTQRFVSPPHAKSDLHAKSVFSPEAALSAL